jgi:nucleoside phosphorylase
VAQTADVVILTPLIDEFDAVRAAMRGGEPDTWGSRTIHRGEIAGQQVIVVPILGMGNSRATLAARDAVAVWNPSRLLLVGIAGGVPEGSDDMHLGDVLIPTEVVGYELAKVKPGRTDRRWDVFKPDHDLLLVAQQVQPADWVHTISAPRPDGSGGRVIPLVHVGPVLSGDKVLAENAAVTDLRQHWPKAVGVEMEAVGVALVAYTGGPAFLMIRAASDFADEDKNDNWRRYAAAAAAEFALAVLRRAAPLAERNRPQAARIDAPASYPPAIKLDVITNLDDSWEPVADLFEVPPDKQRAFTRSANPARELWTWLEVRGKLPELPAILVNPYVQRPELAERMREAGTR